MTRAREPEPGTRVGRSTLLWSFVAHIAVIGLGLVASSGGASTPTFGGEAIAVSMVTLEGPPVTGADPEHSEETVPEEIDPVDQVETVQEETVEETVETVEESSAQPEEVVGETVEPDETVEQAWFTGITGGGEAGDGAPGPASYEGRVFSAIRRNFRTSVEPLQSYRIRFTVLPDGTTQVETVRGSGVDAFDRAVESAIRLASIPPFPYGRSDPVVLSIEFLGPSGQ